MWTFLFDSYLFYGTDLIFFYEHILFTHMHTKYLGKIIHGFNIAAQKLEDISTRMSRPFIIPLHNLLSNNEKTRTFTGICAASHLLLPRWTVGWAIIGKVIKKLKSNVEMG